jgi:glycosyltransferase involved in cell wall biosynthesis
MANSVEAYLHRRCERTLIQDKWRGAWIEKEHRIASSSTLLIPNSPSGAASLRRSRYLREKYKIPAGHVVLLYVGTLAEHFLVRDVVEAAAQSAHVTLIVHSPPSAVRSDYRDEVVSLIEKSSNVHLSVELLDADDLTSLISSADIGVGVFKPVEGNYLNELLMGYSGGKLALYLQSGIPIIASDFPSTQWASECGWCVDPASFSVSILDRILAQYLENRDGYRKEAVAFFNRELSLSRYFEDISRAL